MFIDVCSVLFNLMYLVGRLILGSKSILTFPLTCLVMTTFNSNILHYSIGTTIRSLLKKSPVFLSILLLDFHPCRPNLQLQESAPYFLRTVIQWCQWDTYCLGNVPHSLGPLDWWSQWVIHHWEWHLNWGNLPINTICYLTALSNARGE